MNLEVLLADDGVRRAIASGILNIDIGWEFVENNDNDGEIKPYCRISPAGPPARRPFPWFWVSVTAGAAVLAWNNGVFQRFFP